MMDEVQVKFFNEGKHHGLLFQYKGYNKPFRFSAGDRIPFVKLKLIVKDLVEEIDNEG